MSLKQSPRDIDDLSKVDKQESTRSGDRLSNLGIQVFLAIFVLPIKLLVIVLPLILAGLAQALREPQALVVGEQVKNSVKKLILAGFLISFLFSTIFSSDLGYSLQAALLLLPGILFVFLFTSTDDSSDKLLAMSTGLVYTVLAASLSTITFRFLYSDFPLPVVFDAILSQSLVVPNDLLLVPVFLPFLFYVAIESSDFIRRFLACASILLGLTAVVLVESRACLLAIAVSGLVLVYLKAPRLLFPLFLATLASVVALEWSLGLSVSDYIAELVKNNERLSVWYVGLHSFPDYPAFGVGPGGYDFIYRSTIDTLDIPAWMSVDPRMVPWAHSLYIESLVDRGLLGAITFGLLLAHIGYSFTKENCAKTQLETYRTLILVSFSTFLFAGLVELTFTASMGRCGLINLCGLISLYLFRTHCSSIGVLQGCAFEKQQYRKFATSSIALFFLVSTISAFYAAETQKYLPTWSKHVCQGFRSQKDKSAEEILEKRRQCAVVVASKALDNPKAYWQYSGYREPWRRSVIFGGDGLIGGFTWV